ncbi:MAG: hypothetical protein BGO57_09935 [Sphingomonadales bacterium 63-6]|nr:MAG: hypothetical protein BGO57_09935 [Sphingomonadales bacterium 63-6]
MASRLMEVHGQVQKSEEGVLHLMADHIVDRTALLNALGEQDTPSAGLSSTSDQSRARHPRNVRIIPKSRDFH